MAKLEADRPVLMLLDLLMPGVDGMEVLERTAHTHPEVRVIIVTAHETCKSLLSSWRSWWKAHDLICHDGGESASPSIRRIVSASNVRYS